MPVRRLPSKPSLDHLRHQAKDLVRDHDARTLAAAQLLREFHPRFTRVTDEEIFNRNLTLSDAQLTIAREHGFPSWTRLKQHIEKPTPADQLNSPHHERIEDPMFRRAVDLIDAGNVAGLRTHLDQHPQVIQQRIVFEGGNYFRNPTLLEFIAENPVRHDTLPDNILDVAKVILDFEPDLHSKNETLMLVATGSVPHKCGMQIPLIDLLCDHGADPATAIQPAAICGELDSVHALIRRGAPMTLPIAATLNRVDTFNRLLPSATAEERHLALAMASQYGRVEIVRVLLDAGEDPNRYHPVGGHSHCTPLHQAALEGNIDLARLLVQRGARLDIKDVLWHATPADWAQHQGKTEVEAYLREMEAPRR
jgi:hypothetical protein